MAISFFCVLFMRVNRQRLSCVCYVFVVAIVQDLAGRPEEQINEEMCTPQLRFVLEVYVRPATVKRSRRW